MKVCNTDTIMADVGLLSRCDLMKVSLVIISHTAFFYGINTGAYLIGSGPLIYKQKFTDRFMAVQRTAYFLRGALLSGYVYHGWQLSVLKNFF